MKVNLARIDKPFLFELENESGANCLIDASEAIGGTGQGFRPMELLAGGLAACVAIDVLIILKKQRVDPSVFRITVNGDRKEGIPSPFEKIELVFHIDETIDRPKLDKHIKLVIEKYCSVSASLDSSIQITHKIIGTNE